MDEPGEMNGLHTSWKKLLDYYVDKTDSTPEMTQLDLSSTNQEISAESTALDPQNPNCSEASAEPKGASTHFPGTESPMESDTPLASDQSKSPGPVIPPKHFGNNISPSDLKILVR